MASNLFRAIVGLVIKKEDVNYIRRANVKRIMIAFEKKNDVFVTINKKRIKALLRKKEISDIKNVCSQKGNQIYGRKIITRGMVKMIVTIKREKCRNRRLGKREDLTLF